MNDLTKEERFNKIIETLKAGGRVVLATYTRATVYDQRHIEMFKFKGDSMYVRRGRKAWDCFDGCGIRLTHK